MKTQFILGSDRGWEVKISPENDVEKAIIEAAVKGYGSKLSCGSDQPTGDAYPSLVITAKDDRPTVRSP